MLTKWGSKLANLTIGGDNTVIFGINNVGSSPGMIKAKGCAGNDYFLTALLASNAITSLVTSEVESGYGASCGFAVGSGDTPATDNDYHLESIISSLRLSATPVVAEAFDSSTGKYTIQTDLTLSNATESDIIVKEIGRYVAAYRSSTFGGPPVTGNYEKKSFLIERIVFDTPVTIPAGQSGVIRYSASYQMDTAE